MTLCKENKGGEPTDGRVTLTKDESVLQSYLPGAQ